MPRGDKSSYSSKQKRQAEHIEEGYEKRGTSKNEAERRAWATVNKQDKGRQKERQRTRKKIQPCKFAQRWAQRRQSEEKIGTCSQKRSPRRRSLPQVWIRKRDSHGYAIYSSVAGVTISGPSSVTKMLFS